MIQFVVLRPKTYSYLMNDDNEHKKAKETKKRVKRRLTLNDYIIKIAYLRIKSY